jgi:patatin-like phospholipase
MNFRTLQAAYTDPEGATRALLHADRRRSFRLVACALAMSLVAGCAAGERVPATPAALADEVTVLGIPNARFWPDQGGAMVQEAEQAFKRQHDAAGGSANADLRRSPASFLAISGGGDDGPFAAGLLCGWSDAGTIPSFNLVTGVSTGAMIAPLAFLGRPYNDRLRAMYTTIDADDILEKRGLSAAVFGESLADTAPLFRLISRYINEQMLADIAREYSRGRLLLIGTTSLDQQRPIIWNIGAIAASGRPGALELVRKVILASAAVPGVFPPVMIDVEAGGRRYQEMNVDGGAVVQTFLYPPDIGLRMNMRSGQYARERHAYIIRNARLDPDWASVDRRFLTITGRSIATMLHYSGYNDIMRIYSTTQHDGVDYNLAYIEPTFANTKHEDFDSAYMRSLFDYAYAKGRRGYSWHKAPPILEAAIDRQQKPPEVTPAMANK